MKKLTLPFLAVALAAFAFAAHALGADVPALLAQHGDVLSGLSLLGMAGTMEVKDLLPAIEDVKKSAATRFDAIDTKAGEMQARLQEVEQKLDRRGGGGGSTNAGGEAMADLLQKSASLSAMRNGDTRFCQIKLPPDFMAKGAPLNGVSESGALLAPPERLPGFVVPNGRPMRVRALLTVLPTVASSVEFLREASAAFAAAPVAETQQKPKSELQFELQSAKVITLAHWLPASKQILDDVPQLVNFIDTRLKYGLAFVEELQLLKGSGSGTNLRGLYTAASSFVAPVAISSPSRIDTLRLAIGQLENAYYGVSGIVLHPDDWTIIELLKTTDGAYLKSDLSSANARVLWGIPVIVTAAMTAGTFLVGDFTQAATLFDRQEPTLEIATQDSDDFQKNMIKLRVESRLTLAVKVEQAMVKGAFS